MSGGQKAEFTVEYQMGRFNRTIRLNRKDILLASTIAFGLTIPCPHAFAQESGSATPLEKITVDPGKDNPKGPDQGIVAKRTLSGSKTDTPLLETPRHQRRHARPDGCTGRQYRGGGLALHAGRLIGSERL
ncbi:hypothetical protein [Rhizobium sp. Root1204]|uniref:hypothetical protein n=1 Tax=Rhizobium sp. Root1204 TaxID=1736428 RepID=UPI001FCE0A2D|nr:hypothetical protein [Rhizobium sp. Root1204]